MIAHRATGTILDRILERTASDLSERKTRVPLAQLEQRAANRPYPISLRAALEGPTVSVIAEIKRASPSRGIFPVDVRPADVASAYLLGGAAALSVLTDEPFFRGSLADLEATAAIAHARRKQAPVLRKDFILDEYQIVEARAHGADAVLLIAAALDDTALGALLAATAAYGLEALVEVHDEVEMDRAAAAGARLIGINNRDLRTFDVDLAVSERLAPRAPTSAIVVGESGIFAADDVARLERAGVSAVLVGEALILAPDRAAAVRALCGDQGGSPA